MRPAGRGEQRAGDQEHQRQRELADDQDVPHRAARRRSRPSADALSAGTRSGFEDDHAGTRPKSSAVASDAASANARTVRSMEKSKLMGIGKTLVPEPGERPAGPPRDQHAERAAERRRARALAEQLADQPAARCADRRANGELAASCGGAREHQVGDVSARDQQHEAHGANKPRARRLHVAVEHRVKPDGRRGQDAGRDLLVGDRIVAAEPREDGLDLRARFGERSAVSEAAFDEQPARAAAIEPRLARVVVGVGLDAGEDKRSTIISGTQKSAGMPGIVPVNRAGATPTTV